MSLLNSLPFRRPSSLNWRSRLFLVLIAYALVSVVSQDLYAQPVAPGPKAWYPFDRSGVPQQDLASGLDAVQVQGLTQVPGRSGLAASLASGYLLLPDVEDLNLRSGDFTLSVWVKSTNSTNRNWFTKSTTTTHRYGIGGNTTGNFAFDGGAGGVAYSTTPAFDGSWHHFAAVKRGLNAEVWVDGELEGTGQIAVVASDSGAFAIGRDGSCCEWFNGIMDEAKIWDRALAPEEIKREADLLFADDFESGNLSVWPASQDGGGDLAVTPGAAFSRSQGLQVTIDDTARLWLQQDLEVPEDRYRVRFYFHPNTIAMAEETQHSLFVLRSTNPVTELAAIRLRRSGGRYQVRYSVRDDLDEYYDSPWFVLENRWTAIEIDWHAATGDGTADGGGTLWLDDVLRACLGGLDNDSRLAFQSRLGALGNINPTTSGTYFFDSFESRRETYIGPLPNSAVCWLDPLCHAGSQSLARDVVSGECVSHLQCQQLWKCEDGPTVGTCGGGSEDCILSPGCGDAVQRCFDGFCASLANCTDRIKLNFRFDPNPNDCDCSEISATNPPTLACAP